MALIIQIRFRASLEASCVASTRPLEAFQPTEIKIINIDLELYPVDKNSQSEVYEIDTHFRHLAEEDKKVAGNRTPNALHGKIEIADAAYVLMHNDAHVKGEGMSATCLSGEAKDN